ncbi:hypothetical protein ND446_04895 [Yersinia ruckeri]|uniref:hypothetical protein n=1 Tax=Yersinia ruckeri TaxID=29486 RepID=UPI00226430B7|nr:hypothetical protein [Yersinia ruckeri]UZX56251.1 hypothetical protein ND446_04895 [Yersinia ruckeri]
MKKLFTLIFSAVMTISSYASNEYYCKTAIKTDKTIKSVAKDRSWFGIMKVTDYGNGFTVHFDGHYNMQDFDSGKITPVGQKGHMNIKTESDSSITEYFKYDSTYRLFNYVNNKKRFDLNLYACESKEGKLIRRL